MAQATKRRASSARRSTRKSGSSATPSTARKTSNGRVRTARKTSNSRPRSASTASRKTSRNSRPRSATRSKASTNGVAGTLSGVGNTVGSTVGKVGDSVGKVGESVGTAAQKAKVPAIVGTAAAAGLAGGVALGSRMLSQRKSGRLPIGRSHPLKIGRSHPLKSVVKEAQSVGKEIGKTGFRVGLGDVNMEVKRGNRLEKRDSPLEVLIKGLTSRHTPSS